VATHDSLFWSRREFLTSALLGGSVVALCPWDVLAGPAAPAAKSVIQIWMWGGPSHLDTFDPKPEAGRDYCGPLESALETNVSGVRVSSLLPELAKHADKFSIIRGMTHGINSHETAAYLMQTGHQEGRLVYPSLGAVVARFKGVDAGYAGLAPPYVVLTKPQGRFSESGFLGPRYKPFCTGGDPNQKRFVVEGIVAEGLTDERQQKRRELLHDLDALDQALPGHESFARANQAEKEAYEMLFGKARELFDLNLEKDEDRDRYGRHTFGQSCLMARRLVASGVPHVTINYQGWDTHKRHFETVNRTLPQMDQGFAALLQDLHASGLLSSTIVWWGGEFGRTPRVQWEPPWNGGRGHFGDCFSVVLAGGGFKGGTVVGASDRTGSEVASRPVYPRDLLGSIYTLLGIDPNGALPNPRNLDVTVLPPPAESEKDGGLLKEIMP
jgi:hypothetical protein